MKSFLKSSLVILVFLVILGAAYWGYRKYANTDEKVVLVTEKAAKSDIMRSISATGTVEPEELVNVGAQVQGMIAKFGTDADGREVNYGSRVKAGTVLANIDDSLYLSNLKSAEAQQLQAKAAITSAKASVLQSKARLNLAKLNWDRAQTLGPARAIAQSAYDSAKADFETAQASLAVAEAQIAVSEAQLASANAAQSYAKRNLDYCVIKSPVDGVIIDRRVSVGQTVVSSMSAPSLFLIAKDLKKMEVWVSVNEADVGSIRVGQDVLFSVDAFQGRQFKGKVQKIRLNATMSQNVVTYVVEVGTDNSDGTLLPYLTANVKFILAQRRNVLSVANTALRFTPPDMTRPAVEKGKRLLWILRGGRSVPVQVTTGLSDGFTTEILSGDVKEGDEVITGAQILSSKAAAAPRTGANKSPFMPTPPQRRQRNANKKATPAR
ncbi:MAG: efflux RND transporter periplasmic adaptor subunit [Lentisphaeria bacterium]|nr:efflux RND transporter periplasmic adaptor subunit [Lentisphaeria bacterium]